MANARDSKLWVGVGRSMIRDCRNCSSSIQRKCKRKAKILATNASELQSARSSGMYLLLLWSKTTDNQIGWWENPEGYKIITGTVKKGQGLGQFPPPFRPRRRPQTFLNLLDTRDYSDYFWVFCLFSNLFIFALHYAWYSFVSLHDWYDVLGIGHADGIYSL